MTHLARIERDALCATFTELGPQAPTLCSPWNAADLAAHLVVRERRPDLAPGIWLPALAARTDRGMREYAAKPWPELVGLVRSGPPAWSPARVSALDDTLNFVELFVHHEDVLRGDETPGPRRDLPARESAALWKALTRSARLMFRRSPVGVVLETPDGKRAQARTVSGRDTVVLRGAPAELLLAAYGRRRVAQVEEVGDEADIRALWSAPTGLA